MSLKPILIKANYKITTSQLITLESIIGSSNLPVLNPRFSILNRTPSPCNITVSAQRRMVFVNQVDPDFNGTVLEPVFTSFSLSAGTTSGIRTLPLDLLPAGYGITTELTIANSGPAIQARVTLLVMGQVESSVMLDPLLIINI